MTKMGWTLRTGGKAVSDEDGGAPQDDASQRALDGCFVNRTQMTQKKPTYADKNR